VQVPPTCTTCQQENPEGARFCFSCGAALGEADGRGEERRFVSVLFVDLVGFTARSESLDPEDVRAVLTPYYERVRALAESFGGRVEKFIGDAVMGVFGAPTAYGDDPERAVRAALAIRDWADDDGLQIRIAVNTGEAIVELDAHPERGEAMIAGDVVNTAARLQSAAPVGSVLVGEDTVRSTRGSIEYAPAQPVVAKGKAAPVPAWLALRAIAAIGERPPPPVPMIGRGRGLTLLTDIWQRVADERRAHFVTVFGPAGIGKSRIAFELSQRVADEGARVIRGRSTPYGVSSPYGAFAQQVKQVAQIFDSDGPDEAQAKLTEAVTTLAGRAAAEEHGASLAALVGIDFGDDEIDRETLIFSARVLVESLALDVPTLLVYEDIHWADGSLLDLLETFGSRVREVPVLFVALARPELLTDRPNWGGGLPAYTAVRLEPLVGTAAADLAEQLLLHSDFPTNRAQAIAEAAEGNPLFIEELSATIAEGSADGGALPTSILGLVAARLDALPPDERAALVDASVMGRVFWRGGLLAITPRDHVAALLNSLEERDLIRREPVSRFQGDQQFAFKHALIQEVAYATLPREARRERHRAVAHFLETASGGQAHEALAHHWREANEPGRAVEHLLAAAEHAGRGWAKERAVRLYGEALELVPADDAATRRAITMRQVVASQAVFHLTDAERLRSR